MNTFIEPMYLWLPLWLCCFVLAGVALVRAVLGRRKASGFLAFSSLSCGLLAMVAEFGMVVRWAEKGDWAALEDTVPGMGKILLVCALAAILLNGCALFLQWRKKTETTKTAT